MPISFVRIDDRVIHGQIIARWTRQKPCNGILVIDEQIANDPVQSRIYKSAVPTNMKVGIYTLEEGIEKINKAKVAKNNYFVITKSPVILCKLHELGADFGGEVNVGPISSRKDTETIGKNVSITTEEKEAFEYLYKNNIQVNFQLVPEDKPYKWAKIRKEIV